MIRELAKELIGGQWETIQQVTADVRTSPSALRADCLQRRDAGERLQANAGDVGDDAREM